ncbi:MAG: CoA-binding protein [Chloroflexi bacterium]|nr:CoA-binding protein [Chloroflexota bacterium]
MKKLSARGVIKEMFKTSSGDTLDYIFHPRSIALVGISLSSSDSITRIFLDSLLAFRFEGAIYPVNPAGGEAMGLKVYKDIEDCPEPVDYVISMLPARLSPGLVEKCVRKGVKAIHFYTAGFRETGEEEDIKLELELARIARNNGIRIIGPNCMGIYCPETRLSFMPYFPRESGPVGLVCQSGNNSVAIVNQARWRGIRFSKVVSYGNACDLDESDFLEYLADDPETRTIGLYLEGIKDGKRFRDALGKAAKEKTVILVKAGVTQAGVRAVESHTGALAGKDAVWDALCKQLGVIRVHSLQEMVDMLVTSTFMPRPGGRNAGFVGTGGGPSVLITDDFETRGLGVPPLPEGLRKRVRELVPAAGNMLRNPIDCAQSEKLPEVISILAQWEGVDFIIGLLRIGFTRPGTTPEGMRQFRRLQNLLNGLKSISKPVAVVLEPIVLPEDMMEFFKISQMFTSAGIAVYYSSVSAAEALSAYVRKLGSNQ